ncbi:MAG: alanine racemase [Clostridia bacterium]|nr:alanine racemase [Clostridia bacterium]
MTISRGRLSDNVKALKKRLRGKARLLAVVKADAYGHGMAVEADIALKNGADALAVALVDEAIALREAKISAPILVLGGTTCPSAIDAAVENHITLSLYDARTLEMMNEFAVRRDTVAHAHLKIDTGMRRVGLVGMDELDGMLDSLSECPRVKCEGVFTHFADDRDDEYTSYQNDLFKLAVKRVRDRGYRVIAHASASGATVKNSELWHDMVRPGIALYGGSVRDIMPELMPAQRLAAKPVRIERVGAGESVSYGRTFTANEESVIATLPIGYGDGYPRALSNRAQVLVKGQRANVAGRVCMDMLMVDVTGIQGVSMDDEFVLMGWQGADMITPDELAERAGTISYEIMLGFKDRIPRIYVD